MKISIIITVFNKERSVAESIESALSQTHAQTEVLVVDDGSSDQSASICRAYEPRITFLQKPNGGQVSAVNHAYPHTGGDLVILLDADDCLEAGALDEIAANWKPRNPLFFYRLAFVDTGGSDMERIVPRKFLSNASAYRRFVERHGYFPGPPQTGYAYARWFLNLYLPLDERHWVGGMDGLFAIASVFHGDVAWTTAVLGQYRYDPDSVSHRSHKHFDDTVRRFRSYQANYDRVLTTKAPPERWDWTIPRAYFLNKPRYWQNRIALRRARPDAYPYRDSLPGVAFYACWSCLMGPWLPMRARAGFFISIAGLLCMPRANVAPLFPVLRYRGVLTFLHACLRPGRYRTG